MPELPAQEEGQGTEGKPLEARAGRGRGWRMAAATLLAVLAAGSLVGVLGWGGGGPGVEMPAFAYNSAATLEGYRAATRSREVLPAVPCYCGCGESQGHTSLYDCFFLPDGSYNDHASNCHLCVEQAADADRWHSEGLSPAEVQARTVAKYSQYGPGTDTPRVQ